MISHRLKRGVQGVVAWRYQKAYDRAYAAARGGRGQRAVHVLFASVARREMGGNMACVQRRMVERGIAQRCSLDFDLQPDLSAASSVAAQRAFVRKAAAADVIFTDDNHPFLNLIDFHEDVRVVQLWHALGAFKTVGFARHRKDAAAFKASSRAHRCYTHVIVGAECDRVHYARAFGQPLERVYATGVPRVDEYLAPRYRVEREREFFQHWPQAQGKKVVLFAPTFRGDDIRSSGYDFDRIDFERVARYCRDCGALFFMKLHPYIHNRPKLPEGSDDVIVDISDIREVNDVLPAADLVVTDYSSVIYEASLFSKPVLFYAYDLDEYERSRGFFEPYENFAYGPVARDFDSFMALLERDEWDMDAVHAFRDRHFFRLDGHATDRVVDVVLGDML